jgi:diphthine synthase
MTLRVLYLLAFPKRSMLTFVGLGLWDEQSVTVAGKEAIESADDVFAEFYTSRLAGSDLETLETVHATTITVLDRADVEQDPAPLLDAADSGHAVFLTAGDTMISTTHVDLRLRAIDRGIETRLIHGTTAQTAAASLTGLQNYRFGKATTLPFPTAHGDGDVPTSVIETVQTNRSQGLHTLVYLDIKVDDPHWSGTETFLTGDQAARLLAPELDVPLGVIVARAGSPDPLVRADALETLATESFGDPLHLLVIPAELHDLEATALASLGDAPASLVSTDRA